MVPMKKKICVIIPVYKPVLSDNEKKSIYTTIKKMKGSDIFFISFQGDHLKQYASFPAVFLELFEEKYFQGTQGYNRLMLSPSFYFRFRQYQYMLIVQTDAMILRSADYLMELLQLGYDYWGAPWKDGWALHRFEFKDQYEMINCDPALRTWLSGRSRVCYVGNGGLSLRNVNKTGLLLLSKFFYSRTWQLNEDSFFAFHGRRNRIGYRVAPRRLAKQFSLEEDMKYYMDKDEIPFGVHAWERHHPLLFEQFTEKYR